MHLRAKFYFAIKEKATNAFSKNKILKNEGYISTRTNTNKPTQSDVYSISFHVASLKQLLLNAIHQ